VSHSISQAKKRSDSLKPQKCMVISRTTIGAAENVDLITDFASEDVSFFFFAVKKNLFNIFFDCVVAKQLSVMLS
jgi:hypothetical protein